ncbi:class I SAM-dependent methyltransferase [Sphingobacterium sp. BIGb0165]|uniref:class I SAM-dependent methyltransferase n=1 Tax=Sphingobacterium sp. BIGb0165 TaxID=2940615 RepID=UPI00216A763C|nr:class I SAM-dependent methyltransferase [Sphingobacterium sp. BIGb0165]MCS4229109.1 SAM-dependent methyltransferase [Sphingobacterium sp. BIGb0165]
MNNINSYLCPFCSFSLPIMNIIGTDFPVIKEKKIVGGGERYGGCPNCLSTDRDRLVFVYLKSVYKIFERNDCKILHIAPEFNLLRSLNDRFAASDYICGDLNPGYYNSGRKMIEEINILDIPYPDKYFDLVICNHVLEHIEEDILAMQEIFRVLKASGQAILQTPISFDLDVTYENFEIVNETDREAAFGQKDHVRIYGNDYVTRLERVGFSVQKFNLYPDYDLFGLNSEERLFVCNRND